MKFLESTYVVQVFPLPADLRKKTECPQVTIESYTACPYMRWGSTHPQIHDADYHSRET